MINESIFSIPTENGVFFSKYVELSIFSSSLQISRALRRYFDINSFELFSVVIPYNVVYNKSNLAKSMNENLEFLSSESIHILNVFQSYFMLLSLVPSSKLFISGRKAVKKYSANAFFFLLIDSFSCLLAVFINFGNFGNFPVCIAIGCIDLIN